MYELTQSMESLSVDEIIVYLRKSRSDSPEMSVEDVLKKHEEMIQDYACLLYTSAISLLNISGCLKIFSTTSVTVSMEHLRSHKISEAI